MVSKKNLLKAHAFTAQRLVNALVDREPDNHDPALKRSKTAVLVSLLVGVVLFAGALLLGVLRPGSFTDWQQEGKIIQEVSSGVNYVYHPQEDLLIPFTDLASAKLYLGPTESGSEPETVKIKAKNMAGAKIGPRHTIFGAPYHLPTINEIHTYPIRVCSTAPRSNNRFITVQFGADLGQEISDLQKKSRTIVVQSSDGTQFMVINGISHQLYQPNKGEPSPLVEGIPVVTPGDSWLEAIPKGVPILPAEIPNFGENGLDDSTVGQIYQVGNPTDFDTRYYVMLKQGLARITYLDMKALAAKYFPTALHPRVISETQLAKLIHPDPGVEIATEQVPYGKPVWPDQPVSLAETSVCVTYFSAENPIISIGENTPSVPKTLTVPNGRYADVVQMSSLTGGLLQNSSTVDDSGGVFLATGSKLYPIPDAKSRNALGYRNIQPAKVPGGLIQLIPAGMPSGVNLSEKYLALADDFLESSSQGYSSRLSSPSVEPSQKP